jgi:hypothetical protein
LFLRIDTITEQSGGGGQEGEGWSEVLARHRREGLRVGEMSVWDRVHPGLL